MTQQPTPRHSADNTEPSTRGIIGWIFSHRWISLGMAGVVALVIVVGSLSLFSSTPTPKAATKLSTNPMVANYQRQLPTLAAAVAKSPTSVNALRNYGVALYASGDVSQALTQYVAELKVDKSDPVLLNNLGNVYHDLGSYAKALQSYQNSITLAPRSATAYVNLANLYIYTLNQSSLGITTIQAGQKNLPADSDLGVLLGIAYEHTHDTTDALAAYQAVLKTDPTNVAAKAGVARLAG